MSQHLYRVTIESYPTPDGKPFIAQPATFWQNCLDAHYDGSSDTPLPDFMDWDFEEWIYQEDATGYGYNQFSYAGPGGGHVATDPPMCVPVSRRRHWQSASSAYREAKKLRVWGCDVTVDKSKLIEWKAS